MRAACTSPGSRCAPLVLSLAREPRLRCYSHVDERCAGFFALGLAKASGLPVAVACTSGTAAAELLPAAIEAHEARVPLLLLTADRPPELRENGAGQAIDQLKLFGGAAKWFFEVGTARRPAPSSCAGCARSPAAPTGRRSRAAPGVVHLNFPLREPLVERRGAARRRQRPRRTARRTCARAARRAARPASGPRARCASCVARRAARRVVAGRDERGARRSARPRRRSRRRAGWPLLADPLSGARRGEAAIAHYDALLRDARVRRARASPTWSCGSATCRSQSRCAAWLAGLGDVRAGRARPRGRLAGPRRRCSSRLARARARRARSTRLAERARAATPRGASEDWLARWRSADERAAEAILGVLGDGELSEPRGRRRARRAAARARRRCSSPPRCRCATSRRFWPVRAGPAARALQPRRERHRRHRLQRLRRGRRRRRARSCC